LLVSSSIGYAFSHSFFIYVKRKQICQHLQNLLNNLLNYFYLHIHSKKLSDSSMSSYANSRTVLNETIATEISTKNVQTEFCPDKGQLITDKWYLNQAVVAKTELIP